MKFLALITLLILLVASLAPCNEGTCQNRAPENTSTNGTAQGKGKQHATAPGCSPLCSCSCCSLSFAFEPICTPLHMPRETTFVPALYLAPFPSGIAMPIWRPPQVG